MIFGPEVRLPRSQPISIVPPMLEAGDADTTVVAVVRQDVPRFIERPAA